MNRLKIKKKKEKLKEYERNYSSSIILSSVN